MTAKTGLNSDTYGTLAFPAKLHTMLNDSDKQGFEDIVCWQPGGKSFKICDAERFAKEVMKVYFSQSKYKSFQRQINIYGFRRIPHGPLKGGYIHPHFCRESPPQKFDLVVRKPKKHLANVLKDQNEMVEPSSLTEVMRATADIPCKSCPIQEERIAVQDAIQHIRSLSVQFEFDMADLDVLLFDDLENEEAFEHSDYVQPSSVDTKDESSSSGSYEDSAGKTSNIFPWKLHLMLDYAREEGLEHIVSWVDGGKAFKVHDSVAFVAKIMPHYFDQTKFESFRRQLNLYGFTRVAKGKDRGVISHPHFQRDARQLCHQIIRKTALPSTTALNTTATVSVAVR